MWVAKFFVLVIVMCCSAAVRAETLQEYANKCDEAIGKLATVPDFICNQGKKVPIDNAKGEYPKIVCDRPNRLNEECDPESYFQVLYRSTDAYVVAHCRHRNAADGRFKDIAVIQHNRKNGATCFYQALANDLLGTVAAPSKGESAWPWLPPAETAKIGCAGCHDNGPIIRTPYLAQIESDEKHALPGTGDRRFNKDPQPYAFVGEDFKHWKAYKVEVEGNYCIRCHRLGVNKIRWDKTDGTGDGTARDLGLRATAESEKHRTPDFPPWMPPGTVAYDKADEAHAKQIADCAKRVKEDPLPGTATCRITLFASAYTGMEIPPPGPPGHHSGNLIQSTFGNWGNFEVVVPAREGLVHFWLNNDDPRVSWHGPNKVQRVPTPPMRSKKVEGIAIGPVRAHWTTLIESNYKNPGNLDVVAAVMTPGSSQTHLVHYLRDREGWHGPTPIVADGQPITGVTGNPALIQSSFGTKGNFELVVPQGNVINHYWRDNDAPDLPWHGPNKVVSIVSGKLPAVPVAVALLQSNFGTPGNLEVIVRLKSDLSSGDYLVHYYRNGSGWHGPTKIKADGVDVTGVTGAPSVIQGTYGTRGNFEMVVPQGNRLNHYWRDNDAPSLPWHGPYTAAQWPAGSVATWPTAASLIQSDFGNPGNLELIARLGRSGGLIHLYRGPQGWQPVSPIIADGVPIIGVPRF